MPNEALAADAKTRAAEAQCYQFAFFVSIGLSHRFLIFLLIYFLQKGLPLSSINKTFTLCSCQASRVPNQGDNIRAGLNVLLINEEYVWLYDAFGQ